MSLVNYNFNDLCVKAWAISPFINLSLQATRHKYYFLNLFLATHVR